MTVNEAHLKATALMLLAKFQHPTKTSSYREQAVEEALDHLEEHSPGRCTPGGWMDLLFTAMEREIESRPHGGPLDIRNWWMSFGRGEMRAQVGRVRKQNKAAATRSKRGP